MDRSEDPFITLTPPAAVDDFAMLAQRQVAAPDSQAIGTVANTLAPAVGRLLGFDLLDQPLISNLSACPGQTVTARTGVALKRAMAGRDVVVVFEGGHAHAPIIVGVIEALTLDGLPTPNKPGAVVHVDDERQVIQAEREIVLRCGDASITLTRAGKVIIKGNYILSRSSGYNKIKGASIELN